MSFNSDEILLGKLALAHGFISRERLEICIRDQETVAEPLGTILVRRGFITPGDLQTLLAEQERNLQKRHDTSLQRKQDSLFGRLAVTLGFVKQQDANVCIREQAQLEAAGVKTRLGKLMVQRGLLTVNHVVRILEIQRKQVLWCEKCDTMFNAPRPEGASTFRCRNCGAPLALPQSVTHCEVEELFLPGDETQIAPGMAASGQPSTRPDDTTDVSTMSSTRATLPPPPTETTQEHDDWFIVKEGKPVGPFEYKAMGRMAEQGILAPTTFVWRPGMDAWRSAVEVPEVAAVFTSPASETAVVPAPAGVMPPGVQAPDIEGFRIQGYLGLGSLGHVFRAKQLAMDREVAVRSLSHDYGVDPQYVERLLRDARAGARVNHQGIVQWIDMRQAGGTWHFISEFVEGMRISEILADGGAMPEERALEITHDVAAALDAAHRSGVLHRDVKPANIKLTADRHAKVCDLGLTRRPEHPPDGSPGTPPYSAPETRAAGKMDARSEVYALGMTLFHMLTGTAPPDAPGSDPRAFKPGVSEAAALLMRRMTAREPEARYASGADVAKEIEAILARGRAAASAAPVKPSAASVPSPTPAPPQPGPPAPRPPGALRKRYRRKG